MGTTGKRRGVADGVAFGSEPAYMGRRGNRVSSMRNGVKKPEQKPDPQGYV